MTSGDLAAAYQAAAVFFEPARIILSIAFGIVAVADCYCAMSGRYDLAGMKPMRFVYCERSPAKSTVAWLCLYAALLYLMLASTWGWWRLSFVVVGWALFLCIRVGRALFFKPTA